MLKNTDSWAPPAPSKLESPGRDLRICIFNKHPRSKISQSDEFRESHFWVGAVFGVLQKNLEWWLSVHVHELHPRPRPQAGLWSGYFYPLFQVMLRLSKPLDQMLGRKKIALGGPHVLPAILNLLLQVWEQPHVLYITWGQFQFQTSALWAQASSCLSDPQF